jgi:hypothetical protein
MSKNTKQILLAAVIGALSSIILVVAVTEVVTR